LAELRPAASETSEQGGDDHHHRKVRQVIDGGLNRDFSGGGCADHDEP
jgi:hypothetical protein